MGWNYFSQTYFVECLIFKNFHFIFLSFYLCGHVHVWRSDTILPVLAFHDGSPGVNSGYQTWQQVLSSETSHQPKNTFDMLGIIYPLKIT